MNIHSFTLNAFTEKSDGGNPAGVILNADNLSTKQMQAIAKHINLSETAFVQKSDHADYKVRFFTINREIDLCGHATIATFALLNNQKILQPGKYTQETKAGILTIEILNDGTVFMNQNPPEFLKKIDKKAVIESLNISEEAISDELPVQIVSTGLNDIIIPIKSFETLTSIRPNFEKIINVCKKFDAIGYHLFTRTEEPDITAYCRNFAPLCGINEESATGTACGALSCYLFKYGKINEPHSIAFKQGPTLKNPAEIRSKLTIANNAITEIWIGGTASQIKNIEVKI